MHRPAKRLVYKELLWALIYWIGPPDGQVPLGNRQLNLGESCRNIAELCPRICCYDFGSLDFSTSQLFGQSLFGGAPLLDNVYTSCSEGIWEGFIGGKRRRFFCCTLTTKISGWLLEQHLILGFRWLSAYNLICELIEPA
jgi:hypothetical protein